MSVDHIIPFAVAPNLDKCIANLELMPLRLNMGKRTRWANARRTCFRSSELRGCFESVSQVLSEG